MSVCVVQKIFFFFVKETDSRSDTVDYERMSNDILFVIINDAATNSHTQQRTPISTHTHKLMHIYIYIMMNTNMHTHTRNNMIHPY